MKKIIPAIIATFLIVLASSFSVQAQNRQQFKFPESEYNNIQIINVVQYMKLVDVALSLLDECKNELNNNFNQLILEITACNDFLHLTNTSHVNEELYQISLQKFAQNNPDTYQDVFDSVNEKVKIIIEENKILKTMVVFEINNKFYNS